MTSKVEVEANICSHRTVIEVTDKGDGNMAVHIDTDCSSVQTYAEMVSELTPGDYSDWSDSKVWEMAAQAGLTTTCLVPVALINACWVESGMMSKRLALKEGPLCIRFIE
jgi:hypothetical protein